MNLETLIARVWRKYRGKGASKTPTAGAEKYNLVIDIANEQQEAWANDSNQAWASLFKATAPVETGTVETAGATALVGTGTYFTDYNVGDTIIVDRETVRTIDAITSDTALTVSVAFANTDSGLTFTRSTIIKTGVQDYNLHRSFLKPSDEVIVSTTTQDTPFSTKKPQDRKNGDVYFSGLYPKKVTFYTDIEATSQIVGGTLNVAGYYMPDTLAVAADLIRVDDPNWLVYAVAAELARNDAAKDDQFANLLGMANELYGKMITANNKLGYQQGNTIPYNMPQIGDQSEDGAFL